MREAVELTRVVPLTMPRMVWSGLVRMGRAVLLGPPAPPGKGRVSVRCSRSTQNWNSPGVSPVSLPISKVVTMTARMGQGFCGVCAFAAEVRRSAKTASAKTRRVWVRMGSS